MLIWPSKDPDEVLDYQVDWSARLGDDTISSSVFTLEQAAGLVIDSQSNAAKTATVWLSGGTTGGTGWLLNRITTAGGRTFDEVIQVAIISSAGAPAPVPPFGRPSPANLKAKYPAFTAVPDATIQMYLDDAPVDESWTEGDFANAIMLWAAHTMTLNGIGADEIGQAGAAGVARLKSGTLDVSFKDSSSASDGGYGGTNFGRQFYALLRVNKGGPRVVGGGGRHQSGWAKDYPFWDGVFR